ncbi:MAG: ATP-binding cassette domain-containing protein, partial [Anaerolineae bacterium]
MLMKEAVVFVRDLGKSYGPVVGVSGVSFELHRGEIMGLLGPNGAGKTTTLECLEGIRQPDSGTMRILGINPSRESHRLRNVIGVQLQTSGLPATMTAPEAMRFFCAYHGITPRYDLLELGGGAASTTVISPRMFDEFVAPYDAPLIEEAHRVGQRIVYHTCGGMMP